MNWLRTDKKCSCFVGYICYQMLPIGTDWPFFHKIISMAQCKTTASPLLSHWTYSSLAQTHRYQIIMTCTYSRFLVAAVSCLALTWLIFAWSHDMEWHCTLLALYEGKPLVNGGLPSQRVSYVEHWCFHCVSLSRMLNKQWSWSGFEIGLCSRNIIVMI